MAKNTNWMVALAAVVFVIGCTGPTSVCADPPTNDSKLAVGSGRVWDDSIAYLESVCDGCRPDNVALDRIVGALEQITGILSGLSGSWGGYVLDRDVLAAATARGSEWYTTQEPATVEAQLTKLLKRSP